MKCKYHEERNAEQFCASCGIPICSDCIEEVRPDEFFCFQCAMLQSVTQGGTSIVDKRDKAKRKALGKKVEWGPFHYFIVISSVLIAVMWGVIIFGGKEAPGNRIDFVRQERAFLFMVDSSIKRYAHYENDKYPEQLVDLVPKYLPMKKNELIYLDLLSYVKSINAGYMLSLANPKSGEFIILTPNGISYDNADLGEEVLR